MSETYAQFEVMEDAPRMPASSPRSPSSPGSSNMSLNGRVTNEVEIGEINTTVDPEDEKL